MTLKVELSEDEIKKLLLDAIAKRIGKPVESVMLSVKQNTDFRGDSCGCTVSAVAFIGE